MIGVFGVVEEPCLIPLATTNVGLRWQLPHHPAIRCIDRDRLTLDILSLDKRFVAALDEAAKVMIDVVLGVPIVPGQMPIQRLHVVATADHKGMRAIDVVRSIPGRITYRRSVAEYFSI